MKLVTVLAILVTGCSSGTSKLDQCTDAQAHLWNPKVTSNKYEGNQLYWDAVASCEDKYGK